MYESSKHTSKEVEAEHSPIVWNDSSENIEIKQKCTQYLEDVLELLRISVNSPKRIPEKKIGKRRKKLRNVLCKSWQKNLRLAGPELESFFFFGAD